MINLFELMPLISYVLTVVGYMPEIGALVYSLYTKKPVQSRATNSIWAIWISAAIIYAVYAYLRGEYAFVLSNGITAVLCCIVFILRLMYHRQQKMIAILPSTIHDIGVDITAIP